MEGRRDVDAGPPVARAGVEIEGRVFLALPAAVGLAAGALPEHERAADRGLVGRDLGGAVAVVALLGRAPGTRCRESSWSD